MIKEKLYALGLVLGITVSSLAACNAFEKQEELQIKKEEVAQAMSDEAGVEFFALKSMSLENINDDFFVTFVGHYDSDAKGGWYSGVYEDHQDYEVIYKIDEAMYNKLKELNVNLDSISSQELDVIQSVIDGYEVACSEEVEEEYLCK